MKLYVLFVLLFLIFISNAVSSQSVSINRLQVKTREINTDTITVDEQDSVIISETKTVYFELSDTAGIASIRIKLGSEEADARGILRNQKFSKSGGA